MAMSNYEWRFHTSRTSTECISVFREAATKWDWAGKWSIGREVVDGGEEATVAIFAAGGLGSLFTPVHRATGSAIALIVEDTGDQRIATMWQVRERASHMRAAVTPVGSRRMKKIRSAMKAADPSLRIEKA